jgi:hypothetical protein
LVPAESRLEISLNRKLIETLGPPDASPAWAQTIQLDSDAMHEELIIEIKTKYPDAQTPQFFFKLTDFNGSGA